MFTLSLPLVLDSATGTSFMRMGMKNGERSYDFLYRNPDKLRIFQEEMLSSGSDAVLTSTFGICQGRAPLDTDKISELSRFSRIIAGNRIIIGAVSPIGRFLAPFGDCAYQEAEDRYGEAVRAMESYVDAFITETNMQAAEARAAVCA